MIPGAGGTQRLPKVIGIQAALDMILTGRKVDSRKAKKSGLADIVVPEHLLLTEALKLAASTRKNKPRSSDLQTFAIEGNPFGRKVMYKKAKDMVDDKTQGHYPASYKALDAVFEGYDLSISEGLKLEATLFGELAMTRESASLIHLFHCTNEIKKHPYRGKDKEKFGDDFKVDSIGVVGAGLMGAGIATVAADREISVKLTDPSKESIARALTSTRAFLQKKMDRRKLKSFEADKKMASISPGTSPIGFNKCDVVIEAVFEDLNLKHKILAELEANASEDWIFASNTSALPIASIAEGAKDPSRVLGMHFFSPVEKMPLLEVVVTDQTAEWAVARAVTLGSQLGKQTIVVKDGPGFYTTRALAYFLAEAANILFEGTKIETIDNALTNFGFPVGPITLIDEVGIDVGWHVLDTISQAHPERMVFPEGFKKLLDSGRKGRKTNKGFYLYEKNKKQGPDPEIYKMLDIKSGPELAPTDIVDRLLLLFVNESIRCLEEGILLSPYDGDVGAVFGLGFPPFWGGPFRYVDHFGAGKIVEQLTVLEKKFGPRYTPSQILTKLAAEDGKFFPDE